MSDMKQNQGTSVENEAEIAGEIKKLCNEKGIEKNPKETAKLLHKLGLLYFGRSPDKISLVQAAVLINAAISRHPENEDEMREDLVYLCNDVVNASGAERIKDLVKLGSIAKKTIQEMREMCNTELQKMESRESDHERETEKYLFIRELQGKISEQYRSIMEMISKDIVLILGEAPCKWAHVGLGSLARKEVTPYSDFESVILLEDGVECREDYEKILEYFRWFTTLFQIAVANVGETIIPSIAVPSLNNFLVDNGDWFFDVHTPHGVCCDGFMPHASKTPFGRFQETEHKPWKTELIKPVSLMLEYLKKDVDLKNGYHLADILTVTCFVAGDPDVYAFFEDGVESHLASNADDDSRDQMMVMTEEFRAFSVFNTLPNVHATKRINAKKVVYRSVTLFVSTLGRYYGLKTCSCFGIISELRKSGIISQEAEHNLNYAVAVACEVRLKVYLKNGGQNDSVVMKAGFNATEGEEDLTEIVKLDDIVNYFTIAFCLQQSMKERSVTPDISMRKVGQDVEIAILYYFNQYTKVLTKCENMREEIRKKEEVSKELVWTCVIYDCLFHLGRFEDALKECEYELQQRLEKFPKDLIEIVNCQRSIGRCLYKLERYEDSIVQHKHELEGLDRLGGCVNMKINCTENISIAFYKLGKFEQSLEFLDKEMQFLSEDLNSSWGLVGKRVDCILNMAGALYKLKEYERALVKYNLGLELSEMYVAGKVTQCKNGRAHCLFQVGKVKNALQVYEDVLSDLQSLPTNSCLVTDCLTNIAHCYFTLKDFENALKFYKRSITGLADTEKTLHLNKIAICLLQLDHETTLT
ncbi:uncharacterized protein LOC108950285 [Ciona intestinalis]